MDDIKQDIKEIKATVQSIDKTMAVNTEQLKNHMARTEISERRLEKLEYVLLGGFLTGLIAVLVKMLFF